MKCCSFRWSHFMRNKSYIYISCQECNIYISSANSVLSGFRKRHVKFYSGDILSCLVNGKKNNDRHKTMDAQRIGKYLSYVMLFTITSKHNGSLHNQEITHFISQRRHTTTSRKIVNIYLWPNFNAMHWKATTNNMCNCWLDLSVVCCNILLRFRECLGTHCI